MHSHGLLGVVIMPHSTVCSFVTFLTAVGPPCPLCQECPGWRQHEHQDLQCGLLRHDLWEQRLHHEVASPRNPLWSDCHYIQRCVSQRYLHCSRYTLNMCMHVLQILLACNGKYVDQLWPMLNVLQVVVWCGTVGAGDCGGYPLWRDSAWGPLLATHERNENALSSALRPRNVSVLTVPTVCTHHHTNCFGNPHVPIPVVRAWSLSKAVLFPLQPRTHAGLLEEESSGSPTLLCHPWEARRPGQF